MARAKEGAEGRGANPSPTRVGGPELTLCE